MKTIAMLVALVAAMAARADYWMTFCKTPGGQQYSQIGYVKPDADGFVTIKAGPLTVVVYKTQVWYQKMPGEPLAEGASRFGKGSAVSSELTGFGIDEKSQTLSGLSVWRRQEARRHH